MGADRAEACPTRWLEMNGVPLALTVAVLLASIASASSANITLLPLSTGAAALDGSPYGFYFEKYAGDVTAQSHRWTISLEGGGWCVGSKTATPAPSKEHMTGSQALLGPPSRSPTSSAAVGA